MNKRRRARVLSLVLAVFMLFAVVPAFAPGGMKAVAAAGYITSVSAETNYGNNVLFNGFPYYVNVTINATQNTFANITLYYTYTNGASVAVYNRIKPIYSGSNTILINSTNPVDIPAQYSKIPQNVTNVVLVVYESIWNSTTSTYQNIPGTSTSFNFNVKFPFTVTYTITNNDATYWDGSAWVNDQPFVGIPFTVDVTVQYNQTLLSATGIQLPAPSNLTVQLFNQSPVTWYSGQSNPVSMTLVNYNLSTGQYNFSVDLTTNTVIPYSIPEVIVVTDNQNNLINNHNSFTIWPLVLKITDVTYTNNIVYHGVPFDANVTAQVFANMSGTLTNVSFTTAVSIIDYPSNPDIELVDSLGTAVPGGAINLPQGGNAAGIYPFTGVKFFGTYFNATWIGNALYIPGIPGSWPRYPTINYPNNPIPIQSWKINVTNYNITYNGQVSTYNGQPVFWVNVPNPVFNVSIHYPITPYIVNSTANIAMYNLNSQLLSGIIAVTNDNGIASFSVERPTNVGNVTVNIWDSSYNVTDPFAIPVLDWNVTSNYTVLNYGTYTGQSFYVGVPADLVVGATYTLGINLNSSVVVEVYAPDGSLLANETIPITNNYGQAVVLNGVTFNAPGDVTVKVYNTTLGVSTEYTIPVKDWSVYVNTYPSNLTLGKTADITVNVGESLQFVGTRNVTVTLELPDGYTATKTLTLAGSSVPGAGGYYGLVSFMNVTPNALGLAKVTVTDVLTGKTAVKYIPIEPNFAITSKSIEVTATPASTPVYEYISNSLNIHIQYIDVINGTFTSPSSDNGIAKVLVVDNGGNVLYNNTNVPISNGQVSFSIPVTVNVTGPITISVVDASNSSIGGTATVMVEPWNATIAAATNGTVWEYLDNQLTVSATPTISIVDPSDLVVSVTTNYGSASGSGSVSLPISDPSAPITGTVDVYYNGHLINSTSINIPVQEWNATITVTPAFIYYGITTNVTASTEPTNGVPLTADDLGIKLVVNGHASVGNGATSVELVNPTTNVTGTVGVYYNGHLINSTSVNILIKEWGVNVTYVPTTFYYLPSGYANEPLTGSLTLGLPEDVARSSDITYTVSLPTLGIGTGSSGGNWFPINFTWAADKFVFNSSGIVPLVVKVYDPATNFTYFSRTYNIPIELALNASVSPSVAYVNVPFNLAVNVTSIAASPDITVSIEGTNYTATAAQNGVVVIPNVLLNQSGTYTVVVHDAAINATITRTFEVRDWHIEVVATPSSITAGSVYPVNFTVDFVDDHGDLAAINDNVNLALEFSNTSVIPHGFYTWTVSVLNGHGAFVNAPIFAPVAGSFQIIVTSHFGKINDTETLVVNEPNPADLTYVYVNIRKEGSLQPPGVPVKLYWGFEFGGTKKYFQVYGAQYNSDWSEAMFTLYPQSNFDLYVIAVPASINYPIIVEGQTYSWAKNITYVNETWTELQKNITVTPIQDGWNVMVNVSKYQVNFVNISQEIYTLEVTNVPGLIQITPGSASVQGNAIFSGISTDWYNYTNKTKTLLGSAVNETTITIEPNSLLLKLCDNTHLKPTQEGEYFTFKAMLSITNAEDQFDAQWMPFEAWIANLTFLNDTEKTDITDQILADIGNVSAMNGPVANATIDFHIDNSAIAYLEPTNGTTDANGTVTFKVYTKALGNMTPEQLMNLMGSVNVWATYENLTTDQITVSFGGSGSVSGDITDDTGMQIPGAIITLKVWNGSAWVDAKDYEGNVLTTTSASDGHYAIGNVPATPDGTTYMVVATKGNLTGYAYVTVTPFATSTADVKLGGSATDTGFAMYPERVANASVVYFVFNKLNSVDAYSTASYVARTVPVTVRTKSVLADQFNFSELTSNDVLISIGGPLVNPVTAAFEPMAPVHMVINGSNITIVTPQGDFNWQAPSVWWNVSEGYFIIQIFQDQNGALVVTIYGTDADSTAAGAYYFLTQVYQNLAEYNGVHYIVGLWQDTEPGADIPLPGASQGDTSGFSAGDTITIVAQG